MLDKTKFLHVAIKVLEKVLDAPDNKKFGGHTMGSGGHARAFGKNNEFHKIVIPGDEKSTVILQLQYLLGDLAVDLDLPSELRDVIYGRQE